MQSEGLYYRLKRYAEDININLNTHLNAKDFSRLCTYLEFIELREYAGGECWSERGSREKMALRFYLAKTIALSTPDEDNIPEIYTKFAERLLPQDYIITFNWDVLLEKSIRKVGKKFSYSYKNGHIPIAKMHGSINWVNNKPQAFRKDDAYSYYPSDIDQGRLENKIYISDKLENKLIWTNANALTDGIDPMLVLPGYGKGFDIRNLAVFWYKPEMWNIFGTKASIIGLSVSNDDFIVKSLFQYLFNHVGVFNNTRIINPDIEIKNTFSFIGNKDNKIEFLLNKFNEDSLDFLMFSK